MFRVPRPTLPLAATILVLATMIQAPYPALAADATLRIPLGEDIGTPDPDIFYAVEGLMVTNNVYEGLLRYKPGTVEYEPGLAERYEISEDGLTYTFHIRPGVKFHDGAELNAEAVRVSFQRRIDLQSGPSYMLGDVENMEVTAPLTLVITLGQPVSAFMDWLVAPYGPKLISPKVLKEHGADLAQEWLRSNSAGTGPYRIAEWNVGRGYVLSAFDDYWGKKAHFSRVELPIVPDSSTKVLQLETGDVDMIISGLPRTTVDRFREKAGFKVADFHAVQKAMLFMNTGVAPFDAPEMRRAMRAGLDKNMLMETAYGQAGSVSRNFYPVGSFPAGEAPDDIPYEPARLKGAVSKASDRSITLAVPVEYGVAVRRLGELIQVQLAAAGLDVVVQDIPIVTIFDMVTEASQRPDLLLLVGTSDAGGPDAHIRIYFYTGAPVNSLGCSVPAADAAMDEGLHATDPGVIEAAYAKAANLMVEGGCAVVIGNVKESIIYRAGIGGIVYDPAIVTSVRLNELHEK